MGGQFALMEYQEKKGFSKQPTVCDCNPKQTEARGQCMRKRSKGRLQRLTDATRSSVVAWDSITPDRFISVIDGSYVFLLQLLGTKSGWSFRAELRE